MQPQTMTEAITFALIALVTWALIAAGKKFHNKDLLPSQWQWLRPFIIAALIAFGEKLGTDGDMMQALNAALEAAGLGGVGAMLLHGALKSSPLPYGTANAEDKKDDE